MNPISESSELVTKHLANGQWAECMSKIEIFGLDYDRVVYLDADGFPLANLDHLFDLSKAQLAAPFAWWLHRSSFFSSALMVIEPNLAVYKKLTAKIRNSRTGRELNADMDFLNKE
jgi:alpha-N-acetylglucosamine transferase